jgi:outer membrane protein TolC
VFSLWLFFVMQALPASAETTSLRLTLAEVEQLAVTHSLAAVKSDAQLQAARAEREARVGWPRLTLEGSYRYQTEVPEGNIGPASIQFGQHNNYSIGPALSYRFFDAGVESKALESAAAAVRSRAGQAQLARQRALLDVRLAYGKVQGSVEELRLIQESYRLVESRLADVSRRVRAGSASKLEFYAVKRELHQMQLRFSQAQENLAEQVRKLASLVGIIDLPEPLVPIDGSAKGAREKSRGNFTVTLQGIDKTISDLGTVESQKVATNHPALLAIRESVQAAKFSAASKRAEGYPSLQVFAKSSYEYPNGPLDEQVWQNAVGLSLSWVLFDGGVRSRQAESKEAESVGLNADLQQLEKDLQESWNLLRGQLRAITGQREFAQAAISTAEQETKLINANYRAGAATYLEVQRADTQVLEAKTALARLRTQEIALRANLKFLATEGTSP